jgi:hypothetical protein
LLNGNKELPADQQPSADGDWQGELDKLTAVVGTQANAAALLIQSERNKTTRQRLFLVDGWI